MVDLFESDRIQGIGIGPVRIAIAISARMILIMDRNGRGHGNEIGPDPTGSTRIQLLRHRFGEEEILTILEDAFLTRSVDTESRLLISGKTNGTGIALVVDGSVVPDVLAASGKRDIVILEKTGPEHLILPIRITVEMILGFGDTGHALQHGFLIGTVVIKLIGLGIHQIVTRQPIDLGRSIARHLERAGLTFLGRDDHDTASCTGSVNGGRGSVFEDLDRFRSYD